MQPLVSARARLASGSFWTVAGTGSHMAAGMVASMAVARILGAASFGELGIVRSTMMTFGLLAGTNLGVATARSVSALRHTDRERAGRVIGLLFDVSIAVSLVVMLLCALLAGPIARQLGAPRLSGPVAFGALFIVFASMSAVQIGTLNGFEAFSAAGRQTALEGVLIASLTIAGAGMFGVSGAVGGIVVAGTISFLAKARAVAKACRANGVAIRQRGITAELPIIRTLVIPTLVLGISAQPFAWLARMLLARGEHGMVEVAIFAAAFPWGTGALMLAAQVARPAMPILSNLLATGQKSEFRRLLRDTLLASFAISLLIAIPVAALSPWILKAYGPAFTAGRTVLLLLLLSSIAGAISAALRSALLATGKVWSQAAQSVLWGATLLGVFLVMRRHGALALAYAYLAAYGTMLAVQLVLAYSALHRTALPALPPDLFVTPLGESDSADMPLE